MNQRANRDVNLRLRARAAARRAWVAGRRWITPRLVYWVERIEAKLGVIPEREWFDPVDRAVDDTFPASDAPSHSSPHVGGPASPGPGRSQVQPSSKKRPN